MVSVTQIYHGDKQCHKPITIFYRRYGYHSQTDASWPCLSPRPSGNRTYLWKSTIFHSYVNELAWLLRFAIGKCLSLFYGQNHGLNMFKSSIKIIQLAFSSIFNSNLWAQPRRESRRWHLRPWASRLGEPWIEFVGWKLAADARHFKIHSAMEMIIAAESCFFLWLNINHESYL